MNIGPTASDLTRFCRHSHPEWLPNAVGSRIPDECTLLDGTDYRLRNGQCGWGFDLLRVFGCYSVRRNQETDSVLKILFRICPVWRGLLHKPCAPPFGRNEGRRPQARGASRAQSSPHCRCHDQSRAGDDRLPRWALTAPGKALDRRSAAARRGPVLQECGTICHTEPSAARTG
jgi:hypothetical protein